MLKQNIAYTCGKVMEMYTPLIEQQLTSMSGQQEIDGKPFQILGMDLLIDKKLKAWVLEVNDHPSLNIYFQSEETFVVGQVKPVKPELTDEDICPVDYLVKSRLTKDVILLVKQPKETVASTSHFNSLTKIHPEGIQQREGAVDVFGTV